MFSLHYFDPRVYAQQVRLSLRLVFSPILPVRPCYREKLAVFLVCLCYGATPSLPAVDCREP